MFNKSAVLATAIALALSSGSASAENEPTSSSFWWPDQLNLAPLRQNTDESNPMGESFNYAEEFKTLDIDAVKKDLQKILTTSQEWWPADYGNYGPFFIRMAWHSAGVYRVFDGRGGASGGQQRFAPLNSWPDNVNLDKARRLIWPVKQKYGRKISWADLMVLTGNVAMESMGFKTLGFAGGREDDWEPELVNWGTEKKFLTDGKRFHGNKTLKRPLAAVEMGLIYVNPEGPHGNPDPLLAAQGIRDTFARMAMNDEETVALIAGGHTFGKAHGAHKPGKCVGAEPVVANVEEQGFGWKNKCGTGNGKDTTSSGLEGAWTITPTAWSMNYLQNLFSFEWVTTKSPAGATQWIPKNANELKFVPDAHDPSKRHAPIMFTTDLAFKFDPAYKKIAQDFLKHPKKFDEAFARAWFKLTHRDMGPRARYIGADVPQDVFLWQDPISDANYDLVTNSDIKGLKSAITKSGLSSRQLIKTAWASASTFRETDMRGGANGARIRLEPQKSWLVNDPKELAGVLKKLTNIQKGFNKGSSNKRISLADLIVLGGAVGVESAAKESGHNVSIPFIPGRADATQKQTNINSFAVLEPKADGFRNYYSSKSRMSPVKALIEKADYLDLTVPEMTVLVGGLRVLDANTGNTSLGVLTEQPGALSNDFFVNLLDMSTRWEKSTKTDGVYIGVNRATGKAKWMASPVDLVFGSNAELRAVAEVYASDDAQEKFVNDFTNAWVKVMKLDRFDILSK
ncbi:MAG: peroxidase [Cycloclasticus sp. symbiont of Bathymodiolus heckerae]|nr:MAG: peroxidase [Cycloclasticus sp. symbiont of Bathymodiolus heckerae]